MNMTDIQIVAKDGIFHYFGEYSINLNHMFKIIFEHLEERMKLDFEDDEEWKPSKHDFIFIKVYCKINKILYKPFKKELLEKIKVSYKAYKEQQELYRLE